MQAFVYMQKVVWRKIQSGRVLLCIVGTVFSLAELRLRHQLFQHAWKQLRISLAFADEVTTGGFVVSSA